MRIALLCATLAACSAVDERDAQGGAGSASDHDGQVVNCPNLDCLADSTRRYRPTRALDAGTATTSAPLPESAYEPIDVGVSHEVSFSTDLVRMELVALVDGERLSGVNPTREPQRISYELDAFAGGRFVVWIDEDRILEAELTLFGSGVPVVESSRGVLETVVPGRR